MKKILDEFKEQMNENVNNITDITLNHELNSYILTDSYGSFEGLLKNTKTFTLTKKDKSNLNSPKYRIMHATNREKYIKRFVSARLGIPQKYVKIQEDVQPIIETTESFYSIKLELFCKRHKYYTVTIRNVLEGKNVECPRCVREQSDNKGSEFLYIIGCESFNKEEQFIKIGIAKSMSGRYPNGIMHEGKYRVINVLYQYEFKNRTIALHEEESLQKKFQSYAYMPDKFAGYKECFEIVLLEDEDFEHALTRYEQYRVEPHKY